jgi:uncharacterized membrane protein YccC
VSKKERKAQSRNESTSGAPMVAMRDHPRAAESIRRAKSLGALVFFVAVALTTYMRGDTLDQVGMRALAGGMAGYMVAWAGAVVVWQQLLVGEAKAAVERAIELRRREADLR